MSVLVMAPIGAQELQTDLFSEFVRATIGPEPKVATRRIVEILETLSDVELFELLDTPGVVRNGPCFDEVDRRHESWSLLLIGTDQDESTPPRFRDSDTYGLATLLARWVGHSHPRAAVLKPAKLTVAPHDATDQMRDALDQAIGDAIAEVVPEEVIVLNVGGTPAMRVLTEFVAGRRHRGRLVRLSVNASSGAASETSLLRSIDEDRVRSALAEQFVDALDAGRPRAALAVARAMSKLGLPDADVLGRWAEVSRRMVDFEAAWFTPGVLLDTAWVNRLDAIRREGVGNWRGQLQVAIALVDRAERDDRIGSILTSYVSAAETIPMVWATAVVHPDELDIAANVANPGERCRAFPKRRIGSPWELHNDSGPVDQARSVAVCIARQCQLCPYRRDLNATVEALRTERHGATVAVVLSDGASRALISARNRAVHEGGRVPLDVKAAIRAKESDLQAVAVAINEPTMAGLLRAVYRDLVGAPPKDPIGIVRDAASAAVSG